MTIILQIEIVIFVKKVLHEILRKAKQVQKAQWKDGPVRAKALSLFLLSSSCETRSFRFFDICCLA